MDDRQPSQTALAAAAARAAHPVVDQEFLIFRDPVAADRCRPSCATRPARTMPGSRCRSPPSGASPG
jgi:O-methyltransferase involved in polyketide biosynthesis